jgi:uncharacterized membrane protein (Fun14 family)
MYIVYISFFNICIVDNKSYISVILDVYHVHPWNRSKPGDQAMSADIFTSVPATIGGGFIGGILLGYALKKVVKLIAVVVGLFIAGLAYLQYQQIAYSDWDKIERMVTATFGNVTSQDISSFALSNLGIPLTSGMSAGFAVGFMKG